MADIRPLPGPRSPVALSVAVQGWAFDPGPESADPVIVNPAATAGARMAWAHAQLQQLNVLLDVAGLSAQSVEAGSTVGAVRHFTEQIEAVLSVAADHG